MEPQEEYVPQKLKKVCETNTYKKLTNLLRD